jgi:hypothetical protein
MKTNLNIAYSLYSALSETFNDSDYSYLLHIPSLDQTRIGFLPTEVITYTHTGKLVIKSSSSTRVIQTDDSAVLDLLPSLLNVEKPYFYMASTDINRGARDPDIPLLIFVQAGLDIYLTIPFGK